MTRKKFLITLIVIAFSFAICPAAVGQTTITDCGPITDPGPYVLANNINATGDCLVVQADFVTIDLGGFTISGPTWGGNGILADPSFSVKGLTIRNGVITGFNTGIGADTALQTNITSMRLTNNITGAASGDQSTVKDSTFSGTGRTDQNGIGLVTRSHSLVSGNTANDNGAPQGVSGVGINVGNSSTVIGNVAYRNGGTISGQGIRTGQGGTVMGNTVTGNSDGLIVDSGSTVINNTSDGNRFWGLSITCPSNIIGNTFLNNFLLNLRLNGAGCNVNNNVAP